MSTPKTYRTVFLLLLEQRTAYSPGGLDEALGWTDMPIDRDGCGRPYIRGSSAAGALLSTARSFLAVPQDVSRSWNDDSITDADDDRRKAQPGSLIQPWSGYRWQGGIDIGKPVSADLLPDARVGAPHSQATRTSTNLFDLEVIPRGTQWLLPLDVKALLPGGRQPSGDPAMFAALALREWARDRLWLGRRVSRGLGWMRLRECRVWQLPAVEEVVDAWPNSTLAGLDKVRDALNSLNKLEQKGVQADTTLGAYIQRMGWSSGAKGSRHWLRFPEKAYLRWPVVFTAGEYKVEGKDPSESKSYGLDPLAVGGHGSSWPDADDFGDSHLAHPPQWPWNAYAAGFAKNDTPALAMEAVLGSDGKPRRLSSLPASGVAGAWRAWHSAHERAKGRAVLDPNTQQFYARRTDEQDHVTGPTTAASRPDAVAQRFGYVQAGTKDAQAKAAASSLLIADGLLDTTKSWYAALLEKLALDEFSQAAYDTAKFRRLAMLCGTWTTEVVLEVDLTQQGPDGNVPRDAQALFGRLESEVKAMQELFCLGRQRRIALGSGQSVSYGHVAFDVDKGSPKEPRQAQWALAGGEWEALEPEAQNLKKLQESLAARAGDQGDSEPVDSPIDRDRGAPDRAVSLSPASAAEPASPTRQQPKSYQQKQQKRLRKQLQREQQRQQSKLSDKGKKP